MPAKLEPNSCHSLYALFYLKKSQVKFYRCEYVEYSWKHFLLLFSNRAATWRRAVSSYCHYSRALLKRMWWMINKTMLMLFDQWWYSKTKKCHFETFHLRGATIGQKVRNIHCWRHRLKTGTVPIFSIFWTILIKIAFNWWT